MENISSSHILTVTALNDWDWTSRILLFSFALPCYLLTIVMNATLILIIAFEKTLHDPMYIFLCNLCVNDLCGTTGFYPKALAYLLTERNVISHKECIVQGLVIIVYAIGEFTNLSVMAVDRYIAICRPLHYHSIMSPFTVLSLVTFIWVFPCSLGAMSISLTLKYPFCRHEINRLFCENLSLLNLACKQDIFQGVFNGFVYISMGVFFVFVLFSYFKIILACRKSKVNREKFYSTCIPHLITFLNTTCGLSDALCTEFKVETLSHVVYTFLSIINLTVPPIVNPVIYGIKLGPIRAKILYIFRRSRINNL
ncbi:olfactory receptor-like protein OLF4 [Danio aesculapii]|uniref:olfactory receptor-like protein OLF4 n=1 Tax=Danio aesculapii TaxID=1142201 RepID=UPI0024C0B9E3|nr:olfactory receptor-like protein OLF4 [Danio aesculapii]XP_056303144.1 olfactory receptor-like protein OLF4 [Danio aesculapii]